MARRLNETPPPGPAAGAPPIPGAEHIRQERTPAERAYDAIRELSERDKAFVQKEFGDGRFWKLKAFMEGTAWRDVGRAENPQPQTWLGRMYQGLREWSWNQGGQRPYQAAAVRDREMRELGEDATFLRMTTGTNGASLRRWIKTGAKIVGGAGAMAAGMMLTGGLTTVIGTPIFVAGLRELADGGVGILQAGWNVAGNWLKRRWEAQDASRAGTPGYDPTGRPNPDLGSMNPLQRSWEGKKAFWRNFVEKTTLEDEGLLRTYITNDVRDLKRLAEAPGLPAGAREASIARIIANMRENEAQLQEIRDHNLTVRRFYKFGRNFVSTIASVGGAVLQGVPLGFNDSWVSQGIGYGPGANPFAQMLLGASRWLGGAGSLAYLAARWTEFSHQGLEQHYGDSAKDWIANLKPEHENTRERVSGERTVVEQYLEELRDITLPGTRNLQKTGEYFRTLENEAASLGAMEPACHLVVTITGGTQIKEALESYAKQKTETGAPINWKEVEFLIFNDADANPAQLAKTIASIKKAAPSIQFRIVNAVSFEDGTSEENKRSTRQRYLDDLALMRSIKRPQRIQKPVYVVNGVSEGIHDEHFLGSILKRIDEKNPPAVLTGANHEIRGVNALYRGFFPAINDLENYLEGDWTTLRDNNYSAFRAMNYARIGGPRGAREDIVQSILEDVADTQERRTPTVSEKQKYLTKELTSLYRWYALYPSFREYRGDKAKFEADVLRKPRMNAPSPITDEQILHGEGRASFVRWMETGFGLVEGTHYYIRDNTRDIYLNIDPAGANWPVIEAAFSGRGRVK